MAKDSEYIGPLFHSRWLESLVHTLVHDGSVADDIAQDIRLAAVENRLAHVRNLGAWLRVAIRNMFLSVRRSEETRKQHERQATRSEALPSPTEQLETAELLESVREVVLELPQIYRDTILLLYYEELSAQQIATIQKLPADTVRVRHNRALTLLRRKLSLRMESWHEPALAAERQPKIDRSAPETHQEQGALAPARRTHPVLVVDSNTKRPITNATVLVRKYRPDDANTSRFMSAIKGLTYTLVRARTPVDAEGIALLNRRELARDEIRVKAPGYSTFHDDFRVRTLGDDPFTVGLHRAPTATVELYGREGPLPRTQFRLRSRDRTTVLKTDELGRAWFSWEDTAYTLEMAVPGFAATRVLAELPQTRVHLEPGVIPRGRVLNEDGDPVQGCRVEILSRSWPDYCDIGVTDVAGRFVAPLRFEGPMRLKLLHPDFVPSELEVSDWPHEEWSLRLDRGARVTGLIVDPVGDPWSDCSVLLIPEGEPSTATGYFTGVVASDGTYSVGPVPEGNYSLFLESDGYACCELVVKSLRLGEVRNLNLHLEEGVEISGRAIDEDGNALAGVRLKLGAIVGANLRGKYAETGDDGTFVFRAVAPEFPTSKAGPGDPRWVVARRTGSTELEPRALLIQVLLPHQLESKNGSAVDFFGLLGSANTCMVYPGETDIELRVDGRRGPHVRFDPRTEGGAPIRVFTYTSILSRDGWSYEIIAWMDGSPARIENRLQEHLVTVMARGYEWKHLVFSGPEAHREFQLERAGKRRVTVLVRDELGVSAAERTLFVQPLTKEGDYPGVIHLGITNADGKLTVDFLPRGRYRLYLLRPPLFMIQRLRRDPSKPLRNYLLQPHTPKLLLGTIEIEDRGPLVFELQFTEEAAIRGERCLE